MAKKGKGNGKKPPAPPPAVKVRPPAAKVGPPAKADATADDEVAAQRRVALLRHKLTKAMDDPLMRDQIVRAIRSMMIEDK
jgi:hypothetical protein